jgi:hypothetical protein
MRMRLCKPHFQHSDHLSEFHKKKSFIGGNSDFVHSNFLKLVSTTWRMSEIVTGSDIPINSAYKTVYGTIKLQKLSKFF